MCNIISLIVDKEKRIYLMEAMNLRISHKKQKK